MLLPSGPFRGLPRAYFGVILADPPWQFSAHSAKGLGRAPEQHYATMSIEAIKALPVADLAAPDCALFLWTSGTYLQHSLAALEAWGFEYSTVDFVWSKRTAGGQPAMALGYSSRKSCEFVLLGRRGAPKRIAKNVLDLIEAERRAHSQKPDEARRRIERLYPGPRLELFGREEHLDWWAWGNQSSGFNHQRATRRDDEALPLFEDRA